MITKPFHGFSLCIQVEIITPRANNVIYVPCKSNLTFNDHCQFMDNITFAPITVISKYIHCCIPCLADAVENDGETSEHR